MYGEGVPCWADAQLPDVEAGKRFYGGLFGWTFRAAHGPAVRALHDGEPVAALLPKTDGRMPTVWTVYFATEDVTAFVRRVAAAGGQVVTAPVRVADEGTYALVTDAEGAVFGLWEADGHAGFGRRHEPGAFAWAQLYTRDVGTANAFYGTLFHDALFGPDAGPDFGRAPLSGVFAAEMPPHFLVHFGVRDCEAALAAVRRLGGRALTAPFATSYGTVAVAVDDQGASFALLERSPLPPRLA